MDTLAHSKYNVKLLAQPHGGNIIDLAPVAESIMWQTSRALGQPGRLEIALQNQLHGKRHVIPAGSKIRFGVDGTDLFYGQTETPGLSADGMGGRVNLIEAVDHLKLLAGVESAYREKGKTGSDFFLHLYDKFRERFSMAGASLVVREAATAPLDYDYYMTESLYSMIQATITDAHTAEAPNAQYMIRDELGEIAWRELQALRLPVIFGDKSFATSYTYTPSIENTYNSIKAVRDNEEMGRRDVWIAEDSSTWDKWWYRQLTWEPHRDMTVAEIMEINHLKLQAHNRVFRELKATGIGDFRIQAGTGTQVRLDDANIDAMHWVEEATHHLTAQAHTMDLRYYV